MRTYNRPVSLARAKEKFDTGGKLKEEKAKEIIRKKLDSLKQLTENCKTRNKLAAC